jgi:GTPase SAR1 family protein
MMDLDPSANTTGKPRIALLGEFSAGKSTLANALLGQVRSPVRATATQVPPIWYSAGSGDPVHLAEDGTETAISPDEVGQIPLLGTRAVRVFLDSNLLDAVDLIDMPGSSDPNMSGDIWDALLPLADIVLWCTPAAQAWRQSEAAIWEAVPEALQARSLLLLTRIDTVRNKTDRARLMSRVRRETNGQFHAVLPVSPLLAMEAGADADLQKASGLPRLMDMIAELVEDIRAPAPPVRAVDIAEVPHADSTNAPSSVEVAMGGAMPETASPHHLPRGTADDPKPARVIPRRIRPGDGDGAGRPLRRRPREALI